MTEGPHKLTKEQAREVREHYEKYGLFWIQKPQRKDEG